MAKKRVSVRAPEGSGTSMIRLRDGDKTVVLKFRNRVAKASEADVEFIMNKCPTLEIIEEDENAE